MVKFRIYFLFFLLASGSLCSVAQQNKIDSLLLLLNEAKDDTSKVHYLNAVGWEFKYSKPDTAIILSSEALSIAEKISTSSNEAIADAGKKGIATSFNNLGSYYRLGGDYSKALDHFLKALKIDETLNWRKGIATRLGNIGSVYYEQGNYSKALEYYLKALKIDEELKDKKGLTLRLGLIGSIHLSQENYPKALDYYFKALKIAEENGDKSLISIWLGNIGLANFSLGNYSEALDYYFRALKIEEEQGSKNGIARNLGNIGGCYHRQAELLGHNSHKGDSLSNKALDYYFKALKIVEELGHKNSIAIWLGDIGSLYSQMGRFKEAEKYLLSSVALSDSIGALNELMLFEEFLSHLYDTTDRHELALIHYKKAMSLKDSIFSEEKNKELTRKEMNYEFEKKETLAKAEQDKKDAVTKIIIYSISGGLFLVLILAVFIFRGYKQKQKANSIITEQKH